MTFSKLYFTKIKEIYNAYQQSNKTVIGFMENYLISF